MAVRNRSSIHPFLSRERLSPATHCGRLCILTVLPRVEPANGRRPLPPRIGDGEGVLNAIADGAAVGGGGGGADGHGRAGHGVGDVEGLRKGVSFIFRFYGDSRLRWP